MALVPLREWHRMRHVLDRAIPMGEIGEHTELSLDTTLAAPSQSERARLLYEAENKANEFVMAGDALVEAVLYKLLYARGLRIASIDSEIKKALDQRLGIR